jgi:hypothetical protein
MQETQKQPRPRIDRYTKQAIRTDYDFVVKLKQLGYETKDAWKQVSLMKMQREMQTLELNF